MSLIIYTPEGIIRPTTEEILDDLLDRVEAKFSPIYGEPLRRDPASVIGQLCGVLAGAEDDWVQGLEDSFDSDDPRTATGAAHEAICAVTDTYKKDATASFGTWIATGDNAIAPQAGDVVTSPDGLLRYELATAVTLATATARATSTAVAAGQVRRNGGRCYYCSVAGTTGIGPGPSGTVVGVEEMDGTVTWRYLGDGAAFGSVAITALELGPVGGAAFGLSKIGTPRAGWKGGANPEDVTIGRDVESDEVLRVRRLAELHGPGRAAANAIRAAFLKRSDVSEAIVFQNVEHDTVDGIPGHAVELVVLGSILDADVGATLLGFVAAGIKTHGTSSVVVADTRGILHTIKFTRPADVDVYARINVAADRNLWPNQVDPDNAPLTVGQVAAIAALLAYGQASLGLGVNARHARLGAAVTAAGIAGTLGITVTLDTAAIASQPLADVAISLRQRARLDSSRTTVVVTFEDP